MVPQICDDVNERLAKRTIIGVLDTMIENGDDTSTVNYKSFKGPLEDVLECKLKGENKDTVKDWIREILGEIEDPDGWEVYKAQFKRKKKMKLIKPARPVVTKPAAAVTSSTSSRPLVSGTMAPELASLTQAQRDEFATMCLNNNTQKQIIKAMSARGVTKLNGVSVSRIKKGDMCAILTSSGTPAPAVIEKDKLIKSGAIALDDCEKKGKGAPTMAELLIYINKQGWATPAAKNRRTKAQLCDYIVDMAAGVDAPVVMVPEGPADNCEKRGGKPTVNEIKARAKKERWDSRSDYPKSSARKSEWCAWYRDMLELDSEPARPSPVRPSPVRPSPVRPSPARGDDNQCYNADEKWESLNDLDSRVKCPPGQSCNIEDGKCASSPGALSTLNMKLPSGPVTIHGSQSNLDTIRDRVERMSKRGKSCGTLEDGTTEELLADLVCDGNDVCNIENSECVDVSSIGGGFVKFTYNGRDIVGTPENIKAFKDAVGYKDQSPAKPSPPLPPPAKPSPPLPPPSFPSPPLPPPKSPPTRPSYVDPSRRRRTPEQKQMLSDSDDIMAKFFGEEKKQPEDPDMNIYKPSPPPTSSSTSTSTIRKEQERQRRELARIEEQRLKDIAKKKAEEARRLEEAKRAEESKQSIKLVEEEEDLSEIQRLTARLRDIQAVPDTTPVRLVSGIESLNAKISMCTGISS